jgi:hypothetical protein
VIEVKRLEEQITAFLREVQIPDTVERWALHRLEHAASQERELAAAQAHSRADALATVDRQMETLTKLRLRDLLTDLEFTKQRQELQRKQLELGNAPGAGSRSWFEPARTVVAFSRHAAPAFEAGDGAARRFILGVVGSNLILKDRQLSIDAKKPFRKSNGSPRLPYLCPEVEDVRTFCLDPANGEIIAQMGEVLKKTGLPVRSPRSHLHRFGSKAG